MNKMRLMGRLPGRLGFARVLAALGRCFSGQSRVVFHCAQDQDFAAGVLEERFARGAGPALPRPS
ncbi:MAG TPA: hypothetical protein DDY78_27640 [Planctomycetales bacterium]|jgi:hypothetical protein|nr:hypothetical protein [Planctomycetales bacterium]